jgi:NitT/TauT family transport system permease protein
VLPNQSATTDTGVPGGMTPPGVAAPHRTPRMANASRKTRDAVLPPLSALVAIIALWYAAIEILGIRKFILPAPHSVLASLSENFTSLLGHTWTTAVETGVGLLAAIVVGVLISVLITEVPFLSRALLPWLVVSQAIPKVAVAPLFVLWLGFGLGPKVVVALFIAFFPIVISTSAGLLATEPEELDLFRTMTRKRWPIYRYLKIPRALPGFFEGVKVGVALALVGAVVGEFVSADKGLGYMVIIANRNLDTDLMFAVFLMLSVIGVAFFYAVVALERLALPWVAARRRRQVGGAAR